jgi:hypothetical protein
MPELTITFQVPQGVAAITRRAAASLNLEVREGGAAADPKSDPVFTVVLRQAIDAYHLAELTTSDPAWARLFLMKK